MFEYISRPAFDGHHPSFGRLLSSGRSGSEDGATQDASAAASTPSAQVQTTGVAATPRSGALGGVTLRKGM